MECRLNVRVRDPFQLPHIQRNRLGIRQRITRRSSGFSSLRISTALSGIVSNLPLRGSCRW